MQQGATGEWRVYNQPQESFTFISSISNAQYGCNSSWQDEDLLTVNVPKSTMCPNYSIKNEELRNIQQWNTEKTMQQSFPKVKQCSKLWYM